MDRPLKILHVTAEVASFMKTGGLADVCEALPKAQRLRGHDVRVALPAYHTIPERLKGTPVRICEVKFDGASVIGASRMSHLPGSDVPVLLMEHDGYFWRDHPYGAGGHDYPDNLERFCFFNLAVLDVLEREKWIPDVFHCHDWHSAAIPAYFKSRLRDHPVWGGKPVVFTIHNIAYQGCFPAAQLSRSGFRPEDFIPTQIEHFGEINLMKGGIQSASKVNTVSRTYAREITTQEHGCGLDGVLRSRGADLSGIVNGVDYTRWNPASDRLIARNYSADDINGKAACKAALQKDAGLPIAPVPVFGMVSRLVADKGVDLLVELIDSLSQLELQLVLLGAGNGWLEEALQRAADRYPSRVKVTVKYSEELAHRIYAGSDFYLMPSRTEPCGLSQLYAMAYGSVPIVHRTGGLADTVIDATKSHMEQGIGTGIVFNHGTRQGLNNGILRALKLYNDPASLARVRHNAMKQDYSWDRSAESYLALYRDAIQSP